MTLLPLLLASALALGADDGNLPRVVVRSVEGEPRVAQMRTLSAEVVVAVADGQPIELPTDDLLAIEFADRKPRQPRDGEVIRLANGDRLFLRVDSIDKTHLAGRWSAGDDRPIRVPLEAIRHVHFAPPAARRALAAELERRDEPGDLLILANGDRVVGELDRFDGETLSIDTAGGALRVPRPALRAIGFDPDLVSIPAQSGRRVTVSLVDGSWFTGRLEPWKERGTLRIAADFGEEVELPIVNVHTLRFLGGRAVYLSDLEPAEYRHTPFLGTAAGEAGQAPRLARDRNVAGGALSLRGIAYPRGLAMPSRGEAVFELDGAFAEFRAAIGIDDSAGGGGNAVFAVEIDGQRVFESPALSGRDATLPVGPIAISGARRLVLIVEYGERGDILDHGDWVDAVVIRPRE